MRSEGRSWQQYGWTLAGYVARWRRQRRRSRQLRAVERSSE